MNKLLIIILFGIISFSCQEDFNPYGEFKEKYIFNCILRGDSQVQIAALSKSRNPENFNSELITQDASIIGADIRILAGDSVYIFRDSVIDRTDTSRYKTPFKFYYNNYFSLPANKEIGAEILLPNGRRITSSSKTPFKVQFDQKSEDVISDQSPGILQFFWNISFTGQYFAPRMVVTYTKNVDGTNYLIEKEIPYTYSSEGNNEIPIFPPISLQSILGIERQAITKALNEISQGDPNKENYTIHEFATVQILAFDQNLSKYYSTTNGSLDDLTVRIDEKDFTNINGGYGIFASYLKGEYKVKFLPAYIQSFGYKILIAN